MDLEQYLAQFIEGYLLEDLKSMASIRLPEGKAYGAVGYPMVMTALSGVEILGSLTSPAPFTVDNGANSFGYFWKEYVYTGHPARARLHEFMYQFVRHGLAHSFMTKPMVIVTKHRDGRHLTQDRAGAVWIDALNLAEELEYAYRERLRPKVTGEFKVKMEARFKTIRDAFWAESHQKQHLRDKVPLGASSFLGTVRFEHTNESTRVNSPAVKASYSTTTSSKDGRK
ncbi:MAG: hypothetical protein AB7N65_28680 [Vicinamibacterales bacterium]